MRTNYTGDSLKVLRIANRYLKRHVLGKQLNMKGAFQMNKPLKAGEKIEQLLADPWAVDIEELW